MTDHGVCPACGITLTAAICNTCGVGSLAAPDAPAATTGAHNTGFWPRFLIASVPAAVLALFVESTLYGCALYLSVYLTYYAWGEATAPLQTADTRRRSAHS